MSNSIAITALNTEVDQATREYIESRALKLVRYIPKKLRDTARFEAKVSVLSPSNDEKFACEFVLYLGDKTLTAVGKAVNVRAAADVVEEKLEGQLRRYKTHRILHLGRSRLLSRIRHQ